MLEKTNFSNGKDSFKDYTFSAHEWSAPTMVSVAEIKERLASFNLVGRKIERMKMIGLAYNLRRDCIEECAYNFWDKLEEDERQKCSEYENIDPSIEIYRYAEIDEPFLIGFEDGDSFDDLFEFFVEIEITGYNIIGGGTYRIMLNSINCCGADFWNHLNRYKTRLNDMCKWTEFVLSQNEKINIYGF